jgi:hypothetical protein
MKFDSNLFASAMAFAKSLPGMVAGIDRRDNDPELNLGASSVSVHVWPDGPQPFYFRVFFDYYYLADLSKPHPVLYVDLIWKGDHFEALPSPVAAHAAAQSIYGGDKGGNG